MNWRWTRPGASLSATLVAALALAGPVLANPASAALQRRASDDLYNLDREHALETYRQAIAADPNDPAAYRGLASALWLSITFRRGNMTVDDYLGKVGHTDLKVPPPPPDVSRAFLEAVNKSLDLSRHRIVAAPKDADAQFELGAAVGLRASYIITVEGRMLGAFQAAREAYEAHERVLELDAKRADAGLIVGTYRYIVSALALPVRLFAYVVGFGGGRAKGIQLIERAAEYPGDNQADARLALVLIYNREQRYDAALRQLEQLRTRYPRNRLFVLETASTLLRAGQAPEAERLLADGVARLGTDPRPRMFGEEAVWYYKRGLARVAIGRQTDAEQDLRKALTVEGRRWVQGRSHLELGRLALKAGNRTAARTELQQAVTLCDGDNDVASADQARALLRTAG